MSLYDVPRRGIIVVFALAKIGGSGSTYRGLAQAMGLRSHWGVRSAVKAAQACELVRVEYAGGRTGLAVVRLTEKAIAILRQLEIRKLGR